MGCVICERPLLELGQGRPRLYCSTRCRRVAEYELRRLQRHLERTETEISRLERVAAGVEIGESPTYAAELGRAHRSQRSRLLRRLDQLVGTVTTRRGQ
jgi:hypothetical protein